MPVHTLLFFAYLAVATLVAFRSWRFGPVLIVVAAALQDPIRKTTPGTPAWLVLSIVPVYVAWAFGFATQRPGWWREFRLQHPRVARAMALLLVSLSVPILIDLQYGVVGLKLLILGLLFYGVGLANLVLGYHYGSDAGQVRRLFRFYCVVTAIMLTGVVAEQAGRFPSWHALGTEALGHQWIRFIPGRQVTMRSGFYRSPDVMGWHATTAGLLALALAASTPRLIPRLAWLAISAWAFLGTYLCGRRKFFYMLPVFVLFQLWLNLRRRGKSTGHFLLLGAVALALFLVIYRAVEPSEDIAVYYFDTMGEAIERLEAHGLWSVVGTFRQSGLFGTGLGSAATGAHRLGSIGRPRTWQEGGLSRLAVELGLPGLLCVLWLGFRLLQRLYTSGVHVDRSRGALADMYSGVLALVLANVPSFVVSGQVFGAPFVGFLFSLLLGIALAAIRAPGRIVSVSPLPSPSRPGGGTDVVWPVPLGAGSPLDSRASGLREARRSDARADREALTSDGIRAGEGDVS